MLITTTLRSTFRKLPPKTVKYRNYKNFNKTVLLHELDQKLIQGDLYRPDDPYFKLTEIIPSLLSKHAPIKSKQIRGNQALFINNSLSKMIMQKSKVWNKFLKWPSRENFLNYEKVKIKCSSLIRKCKKEFFQNLSNASSSHSKLFFWMMSNFLCQIKSNIIIKAQKEEKTKVKDLENKIHIDANELMIDEILVELFNDHFINS